MKIQMIDTTFMTTEKIAWDQAAWSEAAKTDPDLLNLDEFLSFRHPESSHSNLLSKADEMLGQYGKNIQSFSRVCFSILVKAFLCRCEC